MIHYSRQPTLMFIVSFTKNLYKGMSIEAIWGVLEIHIQKNHFFVYFWTLKLWVFLGLRTSVKICSSFKTMSSQRCALEQRPIKQWAWVGALNYRSLYI